MSVQHAIPPVSVRTSRLVPGLWDALAVVLVVAIVVVLARSSQGVLASVESLQSEPVNLDPAHLPAYAGRTALRMLAALALSLVLTFTYATLAAKSRWAEMALIPILDILQSVPILGFISVTVIWFMSLAPGRVLGAEFAAIFAIFTSQAWNMAFSFYQSLRTVPDDLLEVSQNLQMGRWMRFWRVEVPFATPALVWNMMMSMSGGWFFVVASDVLTAETLRTDFLDLWSEGKLPIKCMVLVTHNIEEAVQMCDRMLVFASNPGRLVAEIPVAQPQPRDRADPLFRELVDKVYVAMTEPGTAKPAAVRADRLPGTGIATILPRVSTNLISGLVETLAQAPYTGNADLPVIAAALHLEVDDLFPVAGTLQMLRFAEVEGGDIALTEAGQKFAAADLAERKHVFARHLMNYVLLAGRIKRVLDERSSHRAPKSRFSDELEDHMSEEAAEQTLRAVISWARYAELFAYDDKVKTFTLENPS